MGTSKRLAVHYDLRAEERELAKFARAAPLQSLSEQELALDRVPVTIYQRPEKVRAWVRFGAQHASGGALLVRSTEAAAGIEFTVSEQTFRR